MSRAFVIRPFNIKSDSAGRKIDFERVDRELITPALVAAGLEGGTTGKLVDAGNIREDMFSLILEAHLVVADVTVHNANAFYELGIRHALRKRHTVMIRGEPSTDAPPFDLSTDRYLPYPIDDPGAALAQLTDVLKMTLATARPTDSPVFQLLPLLPEADPVQATVMPVDFRQEVERARAAGAVGWLRLLSDEVRSTRFNRAGLCLTGRTQWALKDGEGALDTWSRVLAEDPDHVEANFALANIYERNSRSAQPEINLAASNLAIERIEKNAAATRADRTEASTLRGRNLKSLWRLAFAGATTVAERRTKALDPLLLRSYEAYRDAFLNDLNHFYSGVNALSCATLLLDLAASDDWSMLFDSNDKADAYLADLKRSADSLRQTVPLSVQAALRRMDATDPERIWAAVSAADTGFLADGAVGKRVVNLYRGAIPIGSRFAWDAARGQLRLFSDLGIRQALADEVIAQLDPIFVKGNGAMPAKPLHVVVFAGHTVDVPGRPQPRFPTSLVPAARKRIDEVFTELNDGSHDLLVLASAAAGADILAHESCVALGLASVVCLPMPRTVYAQRAFDGVDDDWRTRYLNLIEGRKLGEALLELSDQPGLPRWLETQGIDPWERGNRWVQQLALSWGAQRLSLVALWDGKTAGDATGGTAHMVSLARGSGRMRVMPIDPAGLAAA